jgi:hypothetical protein
MRQTNRRHDLIAVHVEDPREKELPNVGMLALEDAETGEIIELDTASAAVRKRFKELSLERAGAASAIFAPKASTPCSCRRTALHACAAAILQDARAPARMSDAALATERAAAPAAHPAARSSARVAGAAAAAKAAEDIRDIRGPKGVCRWMAAAGGHCGAASCSRSRVRHLAPAPRAPRRRCCRSSCLQRLEESAR